MTIKLHNLEELNDYYVKETNTYAFWGDDGISANVVLYFDLKVNAKIICRNLICDNIDALSISANDIDAYSIVCKKIFCHNIDTIKLISDEIILFDNGEINAYSKMSCKRIKLERII